MSMIERFENMLAAGQDNALLRFTLGDAYLKENRPAEAAEHLRRAVVLDPQYSAAWKRLGRALADGGDVSAAMQAYRDGIAVAEARGDKQASKEMQVFLRRLERSG
jgi:predicted Zn-dependent protease